MKTLNNVELTGLFGDDVRMAQAAWTSTSRDLTPEKLSRVDKLLKMLADEEHHSPFEKSYIEFLVDAETASHIHIIKHRIGVSVGGESARYKELKADKYHLPTDWPSQEQDWLEQHCLESFDKYHACLARLIAGGMPRKRAKESARFYLPYANSLCLSVSFNWRSFAHFQHLRNSDHAQFEIHEIAAQMLQLVRESNAFPLTLAAFGY